MTEAQARATSPSGLHLARRGAVRSAALERRLAIAALAVLVLTCAALGMLVADPGAAVVLAAAERSPDWLLGPWQVLGVDADGPLAGPLYYAGLWLAMIAYVGVLLCARAIGPRLAIASIVGLHALFLLAPPLLSQDVFSYISYARLGIVHDLDPYAHSPSDAPADAAFAFAGSRDATSVYGPLFTLATYPLAKLSVPVAFWTLKSLTALASLGVVALAAACARRLGRNPVPVALAVGLNPLVLVHVVGGAHNDALVMLLVVGALLAVLAGGARERLAGSLAGAAVVVKLSAGVALPFLAIGARHRSRLAVGAALAVAAALAAGLVAFGADAFDAIGLIGDNQERTSRWSLPQRTADGIAALLGLSAADVVDFTRAAFAVGLAIVLGVLLRRAWRDRRQPTAWIESAGWATLALLLASAWLVPWYAIWLVPLAALSGSRALMTATVAICAYMMVIAIPL